MVKLNDFGKFVVGAVVLGSLAVASVRAGASAHRKVYRNLGWGECAPRNAPSCDEGTTCPNGQCASCYPTLDGGWSCCCPFGP